MVKKKQAYCLVYFLLLARFQSQRTPWIADLQRCFRIGINRQRIVFYSVFTPFADSVFFVHSFVHPLRSPISELTCPPVPLLPFPRMFPDPDSAAVRFSFFFRVAVVSLCRRSGYAAVTRVLTTSPLTACSVAPSPDSIWTREAFMVVARPTDLH